MNRIRSRPNSRQLSEFERGRIIGLHFVELVDRCNEILLQSFVAGDIAFKAAENIVGEALNDLDQPQTVNIGD